MTNPFLFDNYINMIIITSATRVALITKGKTMNENINFQFSKHYKRLIEDLKQINGFTPVMEKVISANIYKLQDDVINEINEDCENENSNRH